MELKAVKEYEEPKYATKDENRKGTLRFILNGGKFSLSVAIMSLLLSRNSAVAFAGMFLGEDCGGLENDLEIRSPIVNGLCIMFYISMLILIIRLIMNNKAMKKCIDEEEKVKLKKRRNKEFFIELGSAILLMCLFFVLREVI